MRIAVSARLLVNQKYTGLHRYTIEMVRQILLQTDHQLLLITDRKGDLPDFPRPVESQVAYPSARHPILFYLWYEWSVPRLLKKWNADVFICFENFCSLRTDIKTLLVIHDLAYLHLPEGIHKVQLAYYKHYTPKFIARADSLFTVSEYTKSDIVKQFNYDPQKIKVAYNGASPRYKPIDESSKIQIQKRVSNACPYFIFIGAIHPRKNVEGLIQAFDHFKQNDSQNHKLVIVGELAWKNESLKKVFDNCSYKTDIIFTGFLSNEELGNTLAAAKCLCLLSFFEGFGVPIIEALNCKIPVIVSNTSSMPEIAGPGGIKVSPYDISAISEALYTIATDSDLRNKLAQEGYQHVQQFTWEQSSKKLIQSLSELKKA